MLMLEDNLNVLASASINESDISRQLSYEDLISIASLFKVYGHKPISLQAISILYAIINSVINLNN